MEDLAIKGNVTVAEVEIPNIVGGFGEGKKAMLAKHVAIIHGKELRHVNLRINENRDRFKDNIDIIDVKSNKEFAARLTDSGIMTKNAVNAANNIYLLSERGYAKLIKIFDDDKSWDLYDQLLDEYFELRDGNVVPLHGSNRLDVLQGMLDSLKEQDERLATVETEQTKTSNKVTTMSSYLVDSPDRKKLEREINRASRMLNKPQAYIRHDMYDKLEDKYGIDVNTRVRNNWKKINEERVASGKKPLKESTLKTRYNGSDFLVENNMIKDAIEILIGMSVKDD